MQVDCLLNVMNNLLWSRPQKASSGHAWQVVKMLLDMKNERNKIMGTQGNSLKKIIKFCDYKNANF